MTPSRKWVGCVMEGKPRALHKIVLTPMLINILSKACQVVWICQKPVSLPGERESNDVEEHVTFILG